MELRITPYSHGITLVEFLVSAMLVTLTITITVPVALRLMDEAREQKTTTQLREIEAIISEFEKENMRLPISLLEIYATPPIDPWDNSYQYLNLSGGLKKTQGKARRYKGMQRINSDYDLYSMGPDGQSVPPLTAEPSLDDIIRASNGKFIGRASDFR